MSYLTQDELDKYLTNLSQENQSQSLRGPRPPTKPVSWRQSQQQTAPDKSYQDARDNLIYPFKTQLTINESIRDGVNKLQLATGQAVQAATDEVAAASPKATPPSQSVRPTASDAFEASLAPRRRPAAPPVVNSGSKPSVSRFTPDNTATSPTTTTLPSSPVPAPPRKPAHFQSTPRTLAETNNKPTDTLRGTRAPPPSRPVYPAHDTQSASPLPQRNVPETGSDQKVRVLNPLYAGVRCAGCNQPIQGHVVRVDEHQWHVDCFQCKVCKRELEYIEFQIKDGQPYCALDYHELFDTRCAHCNTPIEEKSISALGKHYHVGHFFCRECGKPFDESSSFMVHDNHPYCEKDYMAKFGHKCTGCGEYITGELLTALDGDWHRECFVCAECGKAFTSATFYVRNNKPFCKEHYQHPLGDNGKVCARCNEPLGDSRIASAFGKDYHANHFQCARCDKSLSVRVPGMWQEGRPGELVCKACARAQ